LYATASSRASISNSPKSIVVSIVIVRCSGPAVSLPCLSPLSIFPCDHWQRGPRETQRIVSLPRHRQREQRVARGGTAGTMPGVASVLRSAAQKTPTNGAGCPQTPATFPSKTTASSAT
jgi:hypothetical protein